MRGTSLREMSATLGSQGHPISKDALHRHIREHMAPGEDASEAVASDSFAAALAVAVARGLRGWPFLANRVAEALDELGAHDAAVTVQAVVPEMMRERLSGLATTSPERELLEAQCLALAVNRVLSQPGPGHADVALAIADAVQDEGADELADALRECAERACLSVGEGHESPGDSLSRSGAVGPTSAGSRPGPSSTTSTKESA
jgi:hypothetical protein